MSLADISPRGLLVLNGMCPHVLGNLLTLPRDEAECILRSLVCAYMAASTPDASQCEAQMDRFAELLRASAEILTMDAQIQRDAADVRNSSG